METVLNLCDIMPKDTIAKKYIAQMRQKSFKYKRIYVGSYFCGNKFLSLKEKEYADFLTAAQLHGIEITVVIPILTPTNWDNGMSMLSNLLKGFCNINEIVVNDIGTMRYVYNNYDVELIFGRMLNKTYRDFRNADYYNSNVPQKIFNSFYLSMFEKYNIKKIELDFGFNTLLFPPSTKKLQMCIHTPLVYLSTCNICEFASIKKDLDKKFRTSDRCGIECAEHFIKYENVTDNTAVVHYKIGCGIYFLHNNYDKVKDIDVAYRNIYNPFLEEVVYEDFGTVEQY